MTGGPASFALERYMRDGIAGVQGWLAPTTASMIAHLLVQQVYERVHGDVCEIGVHHGRLFMVLANATLPDETAVAVDVFEDQDRNIDQSGRGDRAVFERNLALYAPAARVDIVQASSLDLHRPDFLSRRFRFVSIDGGHTAEVTCNDLWLAEKTLADGGLVVLDDILSSHWTGVLTGLIRYLGQSGTLMPCALLPNKLLLAPNQAAADRWAALLRRDFPLALAKPGLEFPGGTVDSYNEHAYYDHEKSGGPTRERDDALRRLDATSARLRETQAQLDDVHRSTSWRSTVLLRGMMRLICRLYRPPQRS